MLVACEGFYAFVQPLSLVCPSERLRELRQRVVTSDGVELVPFGAANAQFAQTHRAEVHGTSVEFFAVVAAAHEAFVVDAMADAEQVPGLVGQHLGAPVPVMGRLLVGMHI